MSKDPKFETISNDQNWKHQIRIRNSKQIQMTRKKQQNVPNNPDSDSSFWNFLGFLAYLAAVCFGFRASNFGFTLLGWFRISIFGFRILFRWRPFDSAQDELGGPTLSKPVENLKGKTLDKCLRSSCTTLPLNMTPPTTQ